MPPFLQVTERVSVLGETRQANQLTLRPQRGVQRRHPKLQLQCCLRPAGPAAGTGTARSAELPAMGARPPAARPTRRESPRTADFLALLQHSWLTFATEPPRPNHFDRRVPLLLLPGMVTAQALGTTALSLTRPRPVACGSVRYAQSKCAPPTCVVRIVRAPSLRHDLSLNTNKLAGRMNGPGTPSCKVCGRTRGHAVRHHCKRLLLQDFCCA